MLNGAFVAGLAGWVSPSLVTPDTSRDLRCLNSAQELSETKRHAFIMPDLWPLIIAINCRSHVQRWLVGCLVFNGTFSILLYRLYRATGVYMSHVAGDNTNIMQQRRYNHKNSPAWTLWRRSPRHG